MQLWRNWGKTNLKGLGGKKERVSVTNTVGYHPDQYRCKLDFLLHVLLLLHHSHIPSFFFFYFYFFIFKNWQMTPIIFFLIQLYQPNYSFKLLNNFMVEIGIDFHFYILLDLVYWVLEKTDNVKYYTQKRRVWMYFSVVSEVVWNSKKYWCLFSLPWVIYLWVLTTSITLSVLQKLLSK